MQSNQLPSRDPQFGSQDAARSSARSTCWSVIVRAQGTGPDARRALDQLIRRYENTVTTLVRAHRYPWNSTPDDLKQEFFRRMIEHDDVRKLDPSRGRFRNWLRVAVERFLMNELQHWFAHKRGNYITDPVQFQVVHGCTPEQLLMRQFAEDTVLRALQRHRDEYDDPAEFDRLQRFLPGPQLDIPDIRPLAEAWGLPANRLSVRILALRRKHRGVLRALVTDTLDVDPTDPAGVALIDREMRELYCLLCEVPRHQVVLEDA